MNLVLPLFCKRTICGGEFLFVCFMKKKVKCTTSFNSCYLQQKYYWRVSSGENNQKKRKWVTICFNSIKNVEFNMFKSKFILSDKVFRQEGRIATNQGNTMLKEHPWNNLLAPCKLLKVVHFLCCQIISRGSRK